jgi:hypothetical protein
LRGKKRRIRPPLRVGQRTVTRRLRSELLSFPTGRHDDQVDAIGLVGQLLDKMVPPAKPKQAAKPASDRWDSEHTDRGSWRVV